MTNINEALNKFREEFHNSLVIHQKTNWLGVKAQKYPGDAWIYQELIYRLKPDFVIETGTAFGGGTLFLSTICEAIMHGMVITIENDKDRYDLSTLAKSNIYRIFGSSIDGEVIGKIKEKVDGDTALVILDSDHSYEYVMKEMEIYKQFIKSGFYMIVEDTHMKETYRAVDDFLKNNNEFIIDKECEKYIFTFNPGGFLMKL